MLKLKVLLIGFLATVMFSATPALADWLQGDNINWTWGNANTVSTPYGTGGEFQITNERTGEVVYSFCLELNEYIYQTSVVSGVSNSAVLGGRGGAVNGLDPISSATDWLYAQFADGNTAYQNTAALQVAFWKLENEILTDSEYTSWFNVNLRGVADIYIAAANLNGTGSYGTKVLNLASVTGAPHQSQLFRSVPEPATMLLLGSGLIGLAGLGRKKFKK